MTKRLVSVVLLSLYCCVCKAERIELLSIVSPKLGKFLNEHPAALKALSSTEAFSKKTVQIYYFYTQNDSEAKASHTFPNVNEVFFYIRENQEPSDEFLCLMYEAVNSGNDGHFQELLDAAKAGKITKSDFVKQILTLEYKMNILIRDKLSSFKFTKTEIANSEYFGKFKNCPDGYEENLSYNRHVSPQRDVVKEYEYKYDLLRKQQQ